MKFRRGVTLVELVFCVALLGGLILTLGSMMRITLRWNGAVGTAVSRSSLVALLRTQVARAARGAQPIAALSIDAQGRLIEGVAPDPQTTWGGDESLVFREQSGYTVFHTEAGDLISRRISPSGQTSTQVVARALTRASFAVLRDEEGTATGIEFHVTFERGPDATGFVALRTTPVPHVPIVSPTRAKRFSPKGQ